MTKGITGMLCLWLTACASKGPAAFNAEQQLQLQQIIHKVAQRQQVNSPKPIFSVTFSATTTSLLSDPGLLPALLAVQSRTLELVISVAPGPAQLQELSHAMHLSLQLQQFLQDQQFHVTRRLQAHATRSEIVLQLAHGGAS